MFGSAMLNGWTAGLAAFRDTYLGAVSDTEYSKYVARNMRYRIL